MDYKNRPNIGFDDKYRLLLSRSSKYCSFFMDKNRYFPIFVPLFWSQNNDPNNFKQTSTFLAWAYKFLVHGKAYRLKRKYPQHNRLHKVSGVHYPKLLALLHIQCSSFRWALRYNHFVSSEKNYCNEKEKFCIFSLKYLFLILRMRLFEILSLPLSLLSLLRSRF